MIEKNIHPPRRHLPQSWLVGSLLSMMMLLTGNSNAGAKTLDGLLLPTPPLVSQTSGVIKLARFHNNNEDGFANLVEKLLPTVVNIRSLQTELAPNISDSTPPEIKELFRRFGYTLPGNDGNNRKKKRKRTVAGIGSGFIISKDGLIATNNHVIKNATEVRVTLANDKTYVAKVIGKDDRTDLALLKINAKNLPYASFGNSDKLRVGNWVIAIGNPIGLGGSVSAGIVSALGRNINAGQYDDFIQTDTAINRGNSGGPLFNIKGEVVGINTIIYSETGGNIGIGFAIPSNQATDVINQIKLYGAPRRSWLGISLQAVDDNLAKKFGLDKNGGARGALIVGVIGKSPAAKAGLKVGDIILSINNQKIKKSQNLPQMVARQRSGKPIPLAIWRDNKSIKKRVVLSRLTRKDEATVRNLKDSLKKIKGGGSAINNLGFAIRNISNNDRRILHLSRKMNGVLISNLVGRNSNVAGDIRVGTIILSVNDKPARNATLVKAQLKKLTNRQKAFSLFVYIPGSGFTVIKIDLT